MEESQKRRERLKAMRIEAADATVDADTDRSGLASAGLSNPFVEGERTSIPTQYFSPRFDYYTDPMAAFSGSRRDNITPQVSHGHYNMLPSNFYFYSLSYFYFIMDLHPVFLNEFMFAFDIYYLILLMCSFAMSRVGNFTKMQELNSS